MNILYCGPYFSEKAIQEKSSISQAGARWSLELIAALRQLGHNVVVVSHCTEQLWPRGKVFWQNGNEEWFADFQCRRIPYLNFPFLRSKWLGFRYAAEVRKVCRNMQIDAFLCYNTVVPWHVSAMKSAKACGVPCYPIVLDGNDPRKDGWRKMLYDNRYATGVVFLSYWLASNYPAGKMAGGKLPILHLDGGAKDFRGVRPSDAKPHGAFTVLHTGSLNKYRELGFIAKALKYYTDSMTRFLFTGKVSINDVREMCGDDPRIEVKGFMPVDELNAICREADAFLNVRVPDHGDNVVNFPSKLPQSLSWGRPVVSTWVESLAPYYRDILYLADGNTPKGLAAALDRIRRLDSELRLGYYEKAKEWFVANKTWNVQAKRLVDWIESCHR